MLDENYNQKAKNKIEDDSQKATAFYYDEVKFQIWEETYKA